MKVKSESEVTQSCPTLSNLMDCSLPGSSTHGIFQARVLEWGAIAFSGPQSSLKQFGLKAVLSSCHRVRFSFQFVLFILWLTMGSKGGCGEGWWPQGLNAQASVQFSSVAQACPTLCNPMNRSTPGLPVHHHLPEFTQTHVHQVSDAIQPSHPRSSPSPPAPIPPSIRVFSNESTHRMRWPKY